ncbi:MAG: T9SS type A sorting domain-containing protein [Bacteroidota bacterium]|nr:T9SS type A sorting domain-containing protein [Bacteroidota bacterium]MDP4234526.1 T9SS type A sorting domain-containing protein [Bacteroidota bacterium]MDP4242591.1 T9SS type A sorting domain-containing protein [Bacteroidota bacterium]MDP4289417.1 T9SS type A sorting domain-containing protein [Bacteroidota bacterium]
MRNRLFVLTMLGIVFAGLTISSGLRAQYRWHISHSGRDAQSIFHFNIVSCAGEVCTATGVKRDTTLKTIDRNRVLFFRSTDAGLNWIEQDPGLPHFQSDDPNPVYSLQQIDSLTAVAVGDSGLILRTSDCGKTWQTQDAHSKHFIEDVSFSDPMNGILVMSHPDTGLVSRSDILITHDGGQNWLLAPFTPWRSPGFCHADGGNSFRMTPYSGRNIPIYKTSDNWITVDSTPPIIPDGDRIHLLTGFGFRGSDTIIAYGVVDTFLSLSMPSYILQSVDGGMSWTKVDVPDTIVTNAHCMSSPDRGIVFVGGANFHKIIVSSDHGMSWRIDTLMMDTAYDPSFVYSISVTPSGHAVGALSDNPFSWGQAVLARGDPIPLDIKSNAPPTRVSDFYPNPAISAITIISPEMRCVVQLLNVVGVEVVRDIIPADGTLTLDVSSLPRGMYEVVIERDGQMIPAGKVALIGK